MKRFELETELKVIKALNKLLSSKGNQSISEDEAILLDVCRAVDPANVCLIEARNEESKRVLSKFISKEKDKQENIDLKDYDSQVISGGSYSADYLNKLIDLFKKSKEEKIKIYSKKDYPLILEGSHFKVLLAPRVEDDN